MEVVALQEFSCLAMVFPNFKRVSGKKGGYWQPRPLATILLAKTMSFLDSHQRLNNKTPILVNLGDRAKTYGLKNEPVPIQFELLTKRQSSNYPDRLIDSANKRKTDVGLCEPADEPNSLPIKQKQHFLKKILRF
jgi:hypothetical protein